MPDLEKLLQSTSSQRLTRILLKGNNGLILEPKRYRIIAASEELHRILDCNELIGRPIKYINHSLSELGRSMLSRLNRFHEQKHASCWFILLRQKNHSNLQLFEITDYPIFHRDDYIGSYVKLNEVSFLSQKRIHQFIQLLLAERSKTTTITNIQRLSQLESEITFLIALGKSPKEIAGLLEDITKRRISSSSIAAVVNKRIYHKLEASSVGQAVKKALLNDQLSYIPQSILESTRESVYFLEAFFDPIILE